MQTKSKPFELKLEAINASHHSKTALSPVKGRRGRRKGKKGRRRRVVMRTLIAFSPVEPWQGRQCLRLGTLVLHVLLATRWDIERMIVSTVFGLRTRI